MCQERGYYGKEGGEYMTVIVCKKSSAVSPYVVMVTGMVKGCPSHGTVEHVKCKVCDSYTGERE